MVRILIGVKSMTVLLGYSYFFRTDIIRKIIQYFEFVSQISEIYSASVNNVGLLGLIRKGFILITGLMESEYSIKKFTCIVPRVFVHNDG